MALAWARAAGFLGKGEMMSDTEPMPKPRVDTPSEVNIQDDPMPPKGPGFSEDGPGGGGSDAGGGDAGGGSDGA